MTSQPTVELKGLKILKQASDETLCFEANVYIDGKKAGLVTNDGHGGPNLYDPFELETRLDAIAKATMETKHYGDLNITLEPDADLLIGDLCDRAETEREIKAKLKKKVVFRAADDGKIYETKACRAEVIQRTLALGEEALKMRFKATEILNFLPIPRVVEILLQEAA